MFFSRSAEIRFHSLFFLFLIAFAVAVPLSAEPPTVDSEEQVMVRMINEYRAQKGLGKLSISISLTRAADWMSADMPAKNYFGHKDSLGRDPFLRMTAFGYKYQTTKGENLAAGYKDAVRTFDQWKNSPSHNTAMLNGAFKVIGIGRVYSSHSQYKWYWTTDFGGYVDPTFDGEASIRRQSVSTTDDFQLPRPNEFETVLSFFHR